MGSAIHMYIVCEHRSGLAEILCGYLHYYTNGKVIVAIPGADEVIHPLAEQVLLEDGIHHWEHTGTFSAATADLVIHINPDNNYDPKPGHLYFTFQDPLSFTAYNEVLSAFRQTREAIKKECIHLVGSLQLV